MQQLMLTLLPLHFPLILWLKAVNVKVTRAIRDLLEVVVVMMVMMVAATVAKRVILKFSTKQKITVVTCWMQSLVRVLVGLQ